MDAKPAFSVYLTRVSNLVSHTLNFEQVAADHRFYVRSTNPYIKGSAKSNRNIYLFDRLVLVVACFFCKRHLDSLEFCRGLPP